MSRLTLDELLADLGPSEYEDPTYDRVDALMDGGTIELGRRYRTALMYLLRLRPDQ